jgi:hypothetical protein
MTPDYERLFSKAIFVRGALLNDIIFLEKVMDNWLAVYFGHDKIRQSEIFELVFCHESLGYNAKVQIFCEITKRHCPDFERQNPKLKANLEEIGKHRNRFAHWMLDTSEEQLQSNELRLLRSKNFKDHEHYTNTRVVAVTELVDRYKFAIGALDQPPVS